MDSLDLSEIATVGSRIVTVLWSLLFTMVLCAFGAGAFFARLDSRMETVETYIEGMTVNTIPQINKMERNQIRMQSKLGIGPERE